MRFVAVDVETANADMASICSIGVAVFEHGQITDEWYSLIDPEDYFDGINVSIHGISEADVRGAPTFKAAMCEIDRRLSGQVVVTHTHFDRIAMHQAAARWSVPSVACTWLDSARVVRRTWADCARSGYGLSAVCERIGYTFDHHNALEDAKASGQVLLAAMRESGLDLDAMMKRVLQPIKLSMSGSGASKIMAANPDGQFAGEVIVFTGQLDITRDDAKILAASVGFDVAGGVTKKTTMLVVGDVDVQRLAGHEKTEKHRKAEKLVAAGFSIRIIRETDFKLLVATI